MGACPDGERCPSPSLPPRRSSSGCGASTASNSGGPAALKDQGFGVLTEIDVQQTMREKLDVDVEPQIILGACNPQLAHRALEIDPRIATLLPCNVVVRVDGGRTIVDALDPKIIAEVPDNPALAPIADEAGARIRAALDALR